MARPDAGGDLGGGRDHRPGEALGRRVGVVDAGERLRLGQILGREVGGVEEASLAHGQGAGAADDQHATGGSGGDQTLVGGDDGLVVVPAADGDDGGVAGVDHLGDGVRIGEGKRLGGRQGRGAARARVGVHLVPAGQGLGGDLRADHAGGPDDGEVHENSWYLVELTP